MFDASTMKKHRNILELLVFKLLANRRRSDRELCGFRAHEQVTL